MDPGTENSDSQSPSIQSATDQPPLQKNSFEERHSDVDQKLLEEKGKDSSQLRENGIQRPGKNGLFVWRLERGWRSGKPILLACLFVCFIITHTSKGDHKDEITFLHID